MGGKSGKGVRGQGWLPHSDRRKGVHTQPVADSEDFTTDGTKHDHAAVGDRV